MINLYNICLEFGGQKIFNNISASLAAKDRVGLVGRNGSGKSTLLKIVAGQQQVDGGSVALVKNKKIAYLPQEVVLQSDKTILRETCAAFEGLMELLHEQSELEMVLEKNPGDEHALERYADICGQLLHLDVQGLEAEAKKVLVGLGFKQEQFDQPVATLSGGWKMRITLAKLLLSKADFYLLDEPTNHLDIVAQEWFMRFLKQANFGFMLVCHDRYFLNELCTSILELELGNATLYTGNYSAYESQKEHGEQLLESAYKHQQREIKRQMDWVVRNKASATKAKMAQSMLKKVEKIERIEIPPKPSEVHFNFPPITQAGKVVLTVNNVAHSFGPKQIFKNVSFQLERGKRVAIIAANGVGKTTLFNVIAHKYPLQAGDVTFGYNVTYAIFDQDQTAALDGDKSIFDNVRDACPKVLDQKIRTFAGSFLFSSDAINKKVGVLSGGEKNRVGMIKILLQGANLLLLDEPTNHLDIQTKDILLNALSAYQGTILFVSHDHDFINRLATDIIELRADGAAFYPGSYELYLFRKKEEQAGEYVEQPRKKDDKRAEQKDAVLSAEHKKKVYALERKIEKLEKEIARVEQSFYALEYGTQEYKKAEITLQQLRKEHGEVLCEWERLVE